MNRRSTPTPGSSRRLELLDKSGLGAPLLERSLTSTDGDTNKLNISGLNTSRTSEPSTSGFSSIGLSSFLNTSSSYAHRGPYSKPAFLNQARARDASRYTPYSRKPIFVGVKKLDDDDLEPHLTTTAQRVIEILQKNTTPVVEGAKKVALHSASIKTLKPSLTTVRAERPGPPTSRMPFAIDATPYSLPLPPKSLFPPVKIPPPLSSTSTNNLPATISKTTPFAPIPPGISTPSFDYDSQKSSGGGKMKGKTSRLHESTRRATVTGQKDKLLQNPGPSETPHQFKFGKAWKVADIDPENITCDNGKTEKDADPFWNKLFSVVKQENGPKLPHSLPLVNGGDEVKYGLFQQHNIFGGSGFKTKETEKPIVPSTVAEVPKSDTESNVKPLTWPCPTCWIANKLSDMKCICCTEPRPTKYGSPTESDTQKNETTRRHITTWPCPSCMISNKLSDPKCVCCTEPRPARYDIETSNSTAITTINSNFGLKSTADTNTFTFGFKTPSITTSTAVPAPQPLKATSTIADGAFKFGFSSPVAQTVETKLEIPKSSTTFSFETSNSPSTSTSNTKASPSLAACFRFGFGLTTSTSTAPTVTSTVTLAESTHGQKSPSILNETPLTKFPTTTLPSAAAPSNSDTDIDKYKFKPFFGGPKPSVSQESPQFKLFTPTDTGFVSASSTTNNNTSSSTIPVTNTTAPAAAKQPIIPEFRFGAPEATVTSSVNAPTVSPVTTSLTTASTSTSTTSLGLGLPFGGSTAPMSTAAPAIPSFGVATVPVSTAAPAISSSVSPFGTTNSGFTFGSTSATTTTTVPATSTTAVFSFGLNTVPSTTATTSTTVATPTPVFSFGTWSGATAQGSGGEAQKRKAPSDTLQFSFNPPEPKPKMRAEGNFIPTPQLGTGGMKTGSFLEAMKQPGFGSVDKPDGQVQSSPLTMTNSSARGYSGFSNPNAGYQFPVTSTPVPTSTPLFAFGSNNNPSNTSQQSIISPTNNVFNFGSQPSGGTSLQSTPVFTPNLVPNFTFGQSPSSGNVPLFSTGVPPAQSFDSSGHALRRPARKAVRRLPNHR